MRMHLLAEGKPIHAILLITTIWWWHGRKIKTGVFDNRRTYIIVFPLILAVINRFLIYLCLLAGMNIISSYAISQVIPVLPNTSLDVRVNTYADYLISANFSSIQLGVRGARGGSASSGVCSYNGGRGALITARFLIGDFICPNPNPNNYYYLRPGGTLRFVCGKNGRSGIGTDDLYGIITGDGGGGSAVLYKAPGISQWVLLMVAGGGGGAFAKHVPFIINNCTGAHAFNASLTENGTNGGGTDPGNGGTAGNGGAAGGFIPGDGGGGGGYIYAGANGARPGLGGHAGGSEGGAGGSTIMNGVQKNGGYGFGGGGAGAIAGGGGGGYSGGGGGSASGDGTGGGGGSYVIAGALEVDKRIFELTNFGGTISVQPSIGPPESSSFARLFVRQSATGANNGTSWNNAFVNMPDALTAAFNFCTAQIWVASGIYTPTLTSNRDVSISMRNNLAIYGGFAGTETQLSQRNWMVNQTILSADIGSIGSTQDNSYNIVAGLNLNNSAILDGFTLSNANAFVSFGFDGSSRNGNGGGVYLQNSSPLIANCHFKDNNVRVNGGGIFNFFGSPIITNCIFSGNRAQTGGGVYNINGSPVLKNCLFFKNRSFINGAAMFNTETSNPNIVNCTFSNNVGIGTLAIASANTSVPTITNSIIWEAANALSQVNANPPVISYSIIKSGFTGFGNLAADPLFINAGLDNYQLQSCSPAINAGTLTHAPTIDLIGTTRPRLGGFDMGAYERQTTGGEIVYLDAGATGNGEGTSWNNAHITLEAALMDLNVCNNGNPPSLYIAAGTYVAPVGSPFNINKLNARVWGGYPKGGGTRNPALHPVIFKGEMRVLKNAIMDGIKMMNP